MRTTVLKYGTRAGLAAFALFLLAFLVGKGQSYALQEVFGYLAIFTALTFVFFAIRDYRDRVGGGRLSVGEGVKIGLLVTLFAAVGSAIADVIYTTVLYPDFVTDYTAYTLDQLRAELPADEYTVREAEIREQMKTMGTPAALAAVMFVTVVLVGVVVSIVSALLLRKAPDAVSPRHSG